MSNIDPKSKLEATSSQVKRKKAGSFSLFADDEWSAVALRRGKKAAEQKLSSNDKAASKLKAEANQHHNNVESQDKSEAMDEPNLQRRLIKALPSTSSIKINPPVVVESPKAKAPISAKSNFVEADVEDVQYEGDELDNFAAQEELGSTKAAGSNKLKFGEVEQSSKVEVVQEVVRPAYKTKQAVDAHIIDVDSEPTQPSLGGESTSLAVPSLGGEATSLAVSSLEGTSTNLTVPSTKLSSTSLTVPGEHNSLAVEVKDDFASALVDPDYLDPKLHVAVPDPSLTDAQLDVKELEVLRQIKEFNAQQLASDDEDESLDSFSDEDELLEDSFSGMHVERPQRSQHDYSEAEDEDENEDERPAHSNAVVRSVGNIAAFIRIANQIPLLTLDEERDLAKQYRENGDIEAARKLVTSHLRLVVSVAHGYTGYGLPLPDLIQEGNVGLMKAVMHFNPDSGRLAAFAVSWIRAEINDYVLRNWRVVKVATTKAQRKLFFNLRQLKKHLGWFTENERQAVADNLGVTTNDVAEMETRLAGLDIGFDLEEDDAGGDKSVAVTLSPSSYLEDESSDFALNFENVDYSSWQVRKLKEALNSLDERSRYIIKRRWLDDAKATLQELSSELNVSIERVRQIESNAMNKVKLMLVNEGVSADGEAPAVPKLAVKPNITKVLPLTKVEEPVGKTRKLKASNGTDLKKTVAKSAKLKDSTDKSRETKDELVVSTTKGKNLSNSTKLGNSAESKSRIALQKPQRKAISKDHSLVMVDKQPEDNKQPMVNEQQANDLSVYKLKTKAARGLSGKIVDIKD